MRLVVLLVLLAGCDALFHLDPVPLRDAPDADHDSPPADVGACSESRATYSSAGVTAIAVADVDGDGAADLAVAAQTGSAGSVVVVSNAGDRSLQASPELTLGAQPIAVAWYLPAGATLPDLLVLTHPGDQLLEYSSGGAIVQASAPNATSALAVADVLGPSDAEIIVGTTSQLLLYSSKGGVLQNIGSYPLPSSVAFARGRLGGDSADDLAIASSGSNYSALIGSRTASVQSSTIPTASPTRSIAVADLNSDQKDDIAFSMPGANQLEVALAPTYAPSSPIQLAAPGPIAIAELTGDSNPDLVVGTADSVVMLAGDGTGGFANPAVLENTSAPVTALATGDFDHDGHLDIAYANANGVTVMYECR